MPQAPSATESEDIREIYQVIYPGLGSIIVFIIWLADTATPQHQDPGLFPGDLTISRSVNKQTVPYFLQSSKYKVRRNWQQLNQMSKFSFLSELYHYRF